MRNSQMTTSKRVNEEKPREIDYEREYGKSSNKYNKT